MFEEPETPRISRGAALVDAEDGEFPHERLTPGSYGLYVHPENPSDMRAPDGQGRPRHWILERYV